MDAASPVASGHGFWRRLDALTGISTQRWRKVFLRRQRPTPDIIQTLARMFPQHAFWLSTGITDAANGHIAPLIAQTFPERLYAEDTIATGYFRTSLTLLRRLFEAGQVNSDDEKERMCAARRSCPLEHWHDSPLGDAAYDVACSDEYAEARKLWKAREQARHRRIENITGKSRSRMKRRAAPGAHQLKPASMVCLDARSAHQDEWDIFYRPVEKRPRKFALDVLNVAPAELSNTQVVLLKEWLQRITNEVRVTLTQYLALHGLDTAIVDRLTPDAERHPPQALSSNEVDHIVKRVNRLRRAARQS
jgi:hypothetical protein